MYSNSGSTTFPRAATDFIAFVSNLASRRGLRQAASAFREVSDFPLQSLATFWFMPGVAWSNQLSFWREDYPAIMVPDTAFCRYPYYHSSEDTPDRLDYASMARVVESLAHAFESPASAPAVGR